MIKASNYYGIDNIIRICADNPFLNINSITKLIISHKNDPVDYVSFLVGDQKPAILSHFGFYAELVKKSALENVASNTNDSIYLEHVTNYIYTHPDSFQLNFIMAPKNIYNRIDIRLTVDTKKDFLLTQNLYETMIKYNWDQSELINFIDTNENIKNSMQQMIAENKK